MLWQQYVSREGWLGRGDSARRARLEWASKNCGRIIASFNDLSSKEAAALINVLQTAMGIAESSPAQSKRDRAQALGAEGRRGHRDPATIAAQEDLARVTAQLDVMGWTGARLDAFLRSPSSPLRGRTDPKIRTIGDANRVCWALKRIAGSRSRKESA